MPKNSNQSKNNNKNKISPSKPTTVNNHNSNNHKIPTVTKRQINSINKDVVTSNIMSTNSMDQYKQQILSPQKPRNSKSHIADQCLTPIASATPNKKRSQREASENMYSPQPTNFYNNNMPNIHTISPPDLNSSNDQIDKYCHAEISKSDNDDERDGNENKNVNEENGTTNTMLSPNSFLNVIFSPVLNYVGWGETDEHQQHQQHQHIQSSSSENATTTTSVGETDNKQHHDQRNDLMSPTKSNAGSSTMHVQDIEHEIVFNDEEEDVNENVEGGDEDDDPDAFNPYAFIKTLPPHHMVAPLNRTKFVLPPKEDNAPRISLVLDLDETLVHCSIEPVPNADLTFPVNFNGIEYTVYVRKRPNFEHFLKTVCQNFEVIIFTASQRVYAETLLNILDPEGKYIKYRLYRDSCLPVEGNYVKDLTALGRDLSKTVLVDNSPHAFGYQVENGIPIESWFDDNDDTELLKLLPFLERLRMQQDVREMIRNQFKLHELVKNAK
jgi:CTD small phosphatase-like protein 2